MYDGVGVIIRPAKRGKFSASRVFLKGNEVVKEVPLTGERIINYALKEARFSLIALATEYSRGKLEFQVPEQLKLFSVER